MAPSGEYNIEDFSTDLFICSIGNITGVGAQQIVLQNYVWAERRVTPVCTSDRKTKQTMDVQTGRVFNRLTFL